jgi:hypothetical protein
LASAEEAEKAMASRLRQTEFEAHAELLHVQQHARFNVEAMETVARGQGIVATEAVTAYERVEYEAERAMHNAVLNSEAMASDLSAVVHRAVIENNHLRAEVAGVQEMRAVHTELANYRQRNADLFHEAATLESVLSEQKKRHDAEKAELEQEAADLKERLARQAMEYQREGERAINEFLSRHALSEKARKDDEQAGYQRLHGEYRAEKTLAHKLEEELEAANRHVACASALGPAAAVEQKCAHKLPMMEFEHEEALKSEISTCRAKVTQAESAYDRVKVEMHSLSASSESIQESLMKRLAHQESEQRLILDAYR